MMIRLVTVVINAGKNMREIFKMTQPKEQMPDEIWVTKSRKSHNTFFARIIKAYKKDNIKYIRADLFEKMKEVSCLK